MKVGDQPVRTVIAVVALVLVVASVGNVLLSSGWLRDGNGEVGWGNLAVATVVVLPSLVNIAIGRSWNGWLWGTGVLLALVSWVPFLGDAGDLSCTDCAFALLWPISVALPLVLIFVARVIVQMRRAAAG